MSAFWISYDIGVGGDYEGMYEWLDDNSATECGSSVAFVKQYDCDGEDLIRALERDIKATVKIDKRSRIYVILRVGDQIKGKFLFGNRKGTPPWDGYGQQSETDDDDV